MSTLGKSPWRVEEMFRGRAGLDWCEEFFEGYDIAEVSRITIRDGSKRKTPACVWGTCYYPDPKRNIQTYRITCSIKGPFPGFVHTRRSPLYANQDGTYPPVPYGLVPGQEFISRRNGKVRRWVRLYGETELATLDEAIVWIFAHESYHFLRRTRQVPGENAEIEADRFSDEALEHFREGCSPSRFRALQELRAEKAKNAASRKRAGRDHIILGVPHAGREGGA